jgi:hypothetical protein
MNHTGVASTGSRRQAFRKRELDIHKAQGTAQGHKAQSSKHHNIVSQSPDLETLSLEL